MKLKRLKKLNQNVSYGTLAPRILRTKLYLSDYNDRGSTGMPPLQYHRLTNLQGKDVAISIPTFVNSLKLTMPLAMVKVDVMQELPPRRFLRNISIFGE